MESIEMASIVSAQKTLDLANSRKDSLQDSGIEDEMEITISLETSEQSDYVCSVKIRQMSNPYDMSDDDFTNCFGVNKGLAQELLQQLILSSLYSAQADNHNIPFGLRLLATLAYLKHGHLEHVLNLEAFKSYGNFALMRCVPQICQIIVYFLSPTYIRFPTDSKEVASNKSAFQGAYNISGVVGVMNTFRVALTKVDFAVMPSYTCCQQSVTAIKVQVICNHQMRFLDVNPRYPGGKTDGYIWKRSHIRDIMKNFNKHTPGTWLIADRDYRVENIMKPYRSRSKAVKGCNMVLQEIHGVVDTAVAILKARFGCLNVPLPFTHQQCANIVTSCCTLHNILLSKSIP